jgi:hypothetical protein
VLLLQLGVISSLSDAIKFFLTLDLFSHVAYFSVYISKQQVHKIHCHKHMLWEKSSSVLEICRTFDLIGTVHCDKFV